MPMGVSARGPSTRCSAEAKAIEGPVHEARWLGGGMIAVSGMDYVYRDEWTADVVDLTTGETMSTVRWNENPFPKLLAASSADW